MTNWKLVSFPIEPGEELPPERKVVLVWVRGSHLPWCAYVRYAAGDRSCPFFVVYHGNPERGTEVIAWCDCLPNVGPRLSPPDSQLTEMYDREQQNGRGYPARRGSPKVKK